MISKKHPSSARCERRRSYLSSRLRDLRRAAHALPADAPFETDTLPFSGLTNAEAARVCGFRNLLDWASAKKRLGIGPVQTQTGRRFVLDARMVKRAKALAGTFSR